MLDAYCNSKSLCNSLNFVVLITLFIGILILLLQIYRNREMEELAPNHAEGGRAKDSITWFESQQSNYCNCLPLTEGWWEDPLIEVKWLPQGCTANGRFWTTYSLASSIEAAMALTALPALLGLCLYETRLSLNLRWYPLAWSASLLCSCGPQWPLAVPTHLIPSSKHRIFPIKKIL